MTQDPARDTKNPRSVKGQELAREDILHLLQGLNTDPLYQALERMKKNSYHLWKVLNELYLSPHSDSSKLGAWRISPEGSQERRKALFHDKAIELLLVATRS